MRIVYTIGLCLILPGAGCELLQPLDFLSRPKAPKVQVVAVTVAEQTEQGARVEIVLAFENRSDVALPLVDANCRLRVGEAGTFAMSSPVKKTLPAGGQQTVTLAAAFATDQPLAGSRYRVEGSVSYQLPQTFIENLAEESLPLPTVSFASKGNLP